MLEQLKQLANDEEAPTAVEYALMVACIAVVIIAGAALLGGATNTKLTNVATEIALPR